MGSANLTRPPPSLKTPASRKKKQFKSEFLTLMKQMTEDSDGDSSGYLTDTSWKKHTTQEVRVFIMGATAAASGSETSIDPLTAKRLLKKFTKKKRQFTKSCAPDIFQSIMMDLLGDLPFVLVYIDDILIIQRVGETEEDHLLKVDPNFCFKKIVEA